MEQTSERNCANERERSSEGLASNTSSHAALDGIGVPSQPTRTFRFLSDAQMREIGALFHLLDLNKDGFLSAIRAVALCRQLGFNVDRTSVDRGSPNVSLQQECCVAAPLHPSPFLISIPITTPPFLT
eukprot:6186577-Pleurochrysis_carterae.AAC.4